MSKAPKVHKYKDVDIFYNLSNGYLSFNFEGEREVKYIFEAEKIIDEPRWEECDLKGFYLDHSLEYHIGLAQAKRRDTKSGKPDWLFKGKYDMQYKRPQTFREDKTKVYPVTDKTKKIYQDWSADRDLALKAVRKADTTASLLKDQKPF